MNIRFYATLFTILGLGVTNLAHAASCADTTPVTTVKSIGGGQSNSINSTMYAVFTGKITTTNGLTNRGKNTVKVCEGTTVSYRVVGGTGTSRWGSTIETPASCVNRPSSGTLAPGDKLTCTNKNLGGSDTDRFRIVSVR